ncbi:hypothetical protein [Paenibacillus xylanexedens]|uniref:hypothetical protein n=1 Tax=Paenibacillus xylanexedens TaxID=528191 RepID=UPI0011A76B5E|nr:hypothetical protein [Paenibacillus xylanexedens]
MINQINMDSSGDKRLDQEHLEIQLDKLKSVYKKKTLEIINLEKETETILKKLTNMDLQINDRAENLQILQIQVESLEISLNNARLQVPYENDYTNRKHYYQATYDSVDTQCFRRIPLENGQLKQVIISLDGMDFQIKRANELLGDLANRDYVCFHFERDIEKDVECISENNYVYKSEVQLLSWLKSVNIVPLILVNSVQQTALLDLIEEKYIWYDVCNNSDLLWGEQAASKLKHFELLEAADLVTYSDRKWKRYTLLRHDSMIWKPYEGCYEALIKMIFGESLNDDN